MSPSPLRDGALEAELRPMVTVTRGPNRPNCNRARQCLNPCQCEVPMHELQSQSPVWHGTTILTVRKGGKVVIGGDGQVSIGQTVIKSNAQKVRKLRKGDVNRGGFRG